MSITEIASYIILLEMIYALYIMPKTLGEYMGVFKEQADPFFGKFKSDCKWTHGITFKSAAMGFIILMPIFILIEVEIEKYYGITIASIILFIILIPITYLNRQKTKKNSIIAKRLNKKEHPQKEN